MMTDLQVRSSEATVDGLGVLTPYWLWCTRGCVLGLGLALVGCAGHPAEDNKQANWSVDFSLCNCTNEEVMYEDSFDGNPAGPCQYID